jgi:cytochrome c peroxidase
MFGKLARAGPFALLVISAELLSAQSPGSAQSPVLPIGKRVSINVPLGLPPLNIPPDNPPTVETIALGRHLFYDPALSIDGTIACATCHDPTKGFTDGKAVSTGIQSKTGTRSAPTVLNSAYYQALFWDGRSSGLEAQAAGPITNPIEMANSPEAVVQRLQASAFYREEFKNAWGADQISFEMVRKSIASFERTVLSGNSPFDRYYYGGNKEAMSESARRGLKVFTDPKRGNCAACHTIGGSSALFTDQKFHNIGIGANTDGSLADSGRYAETKKDADVGSFKTPSLRNAVWTAPYMHDGSVPSLKDVIDHYIGGGNSNPHLDKKIRVLDFLSGQERGDLLEFLQSLTGVMPPNVGPPDDLKRSETESHTE